MNKKSAIAILIINSLLCVFIVLGTYFFMRGWGATIKVVCYAIAGVGFIFELITFFLKKYALFKSAFVLVVCAAIVVAVVALISELGRLNDYENDEERAKALQAMLESTGGWGLFVYFLIQVLQVVILPLPAAVCYVPGALIWGPLNATLVATAGVVCGSVICYFIGKFFGKKAVVWIAGKETTEKYAAYLAKRGKVLFVLMQILPFFPDDILCMVVGMSGMNFWFFFISIIVVRPIVIAAYCFLGSGTLIPFDQPWGIAVWVVIFAICIAFAVLSFKYQDKFENWLISKLSRRKKSSVTAVEEQSAQVENAEESQPEATPQSPVQNETEPPPADETQNE